MKVLSFGDESLELIQYPRRTMEVWRARGFTFHSQPDSPEAVFASPISSGFGIQPSVTVRNLKKARNGTVSAELDGEHQILGTLDPDWIELAEFDWIFPGMLCGRLEVSGEPLLIYSDQPDPFSGAARTPKAPLDSTQMHALLAAVPLKPVGRLAVISETTKLPKYLRLGEELRSYSFGRPQHARLDLPPKILTQLDPPSPPPKGAKRVLFIP